MTDYGFNGVRFATHSQFGGRFPNDTALAAIFPWADFYGGSQRAYLAKVRCGCVLCLNAHLEPSMQPNLGLTDPVRRLRVSETRDLSVALRTST